MFLHRTQLTLSTADVDVDRNQVLFFHNREPSTESKANITCYNIEPRD